MTKILSLQRVQEQGFEICIWSTVSCYSHASCGSALSVAGVTTYDPDGGA